MTKPDPYGLPDDAPVVINFSGGRSSGFMLRQILDRYSGKLPDNVIVAFQNTGKERPETLDFIHEVDVRWSVPVVWLEYRYRKHPPPGEYKIIHKVVDYHTASRNGEPFANLISGQMLPNRGRRVCTQDLKIETLKKYMRRDRKVRQWYSVIGIRADEEARANRISSHSRVRTRDRYTYELGRLMPMLYAGATHDDVKAFWKANDFDLGIDSALGNCDLCFLKKKSTLLYILRKNPELADWWIEQEAEKREALTRTNKKQTAQFHPDYTFAELLEEAQTGIFRKQYPLDLDEGGIDCFCGD